MTLYMNGANIRERTRTLTDELFDCVSGAIIGIWLFSFGLGLAALFLFLPVSYRGPFGVWAAIVCLAAAVFGGYLARPWFVAYVALRTHRKAMEAETAKHGSGWASS